jgi:hypothetical protein
MITHPDEERLNDWVDGLLDDADARTMAAHVDECPACAKTAADLRALLDLAGRLPASIDPPEGTWDAIAARTVDLGRTRRAVLHDLRAPLAAAAIVLVALGAGASALLLRAPAPSEPAVAVVDDDMAEASAATVATLVAAEDTYQRAFDRLLVEFRANRAELDSATVRVVEENIAIIDTALANARAALVADPANRALPLLITETHLKRIKLVERALRLSAGPERSQA